LAGEKTIIGLVWISDPVKLDARNTIDELKKQGVLPVMLSGDREKTAQEIAQSVGIEKVFANILPAEKSDEIRKMKAEGKIVAMVGDGVNDAPALAAAQVGVAMSTGTDAAISTANITLLHGDIGKLLTAIKLSQKTMRIVKENLFWAFAYNVIGIPIAAGLLYPFTKTLLNPMYGGMAMALSSVMVVTNSLRLKSIRI
jgi:P-type Cu+ transporter